MNRAAEFATKFAERGYAAYPLNVSLDESGDKVLTFKNGMWAAGEYPTDPDEIEKHWEGYSGLMINTGKSGLVVVDIDVSKGKDGFGELEKSGVKLPDTPMKVRTITGGEHWFYREPEGVSVMTDNSGKLAKDVDIRARGGLVIAPPTEVPDRGSYEVVGTVVPVAKLPVFPSELAAQLQPRDQAELHISDDRPTLTSEQRERLERILERCYRDLRQMGDGERNAVMRLRLNRLFGIAKTLGHDLFAVADLVREAYFYSGGTSETEMESFIEWALHHARYEIPEEATDEEFEAEVQQRIRQERIREAARKRINPFRTSDPSDDDILEFDPEMEEDWFIPEVLPRGETAILFGSANSGKTFAALDLGAGIATGTEAWGFEVPKGKVLYLAGEGVRRLAVRKRAWEVAHEAKADDFQLRKMRLLLGADESVAKNAQMIHDYAPDLIIVDTLLRAAEGMALEDPGQAIQVIAQLDRIREASPGATLLVLHHPANSNPENPSGSYPIRANVDTIIKLVNENGFRTMSINKAKEGDTRWTDIFELQDLDIPGSSFKSGVWVQSDGPVPEIDDEAIRFYQENYGY